jgi:hypothetical protein
MALTTASLRSTIFSAQTILGGYGMKYLVVTKRRPNPLPVETMEPARDWIQVMLANGTLDCCYGLLNGGGVSIMNADSHDHLLKLLMEYPESRWVDFEIQGLCDINKIFQQAEELAVARGAKRA